MTAQLAAQLQDALGPDYRIEQELDGGGMSRLFLATDLRHNRRVVVKVLSPELVSTQSAARFKREIELTVKLQHPHILPILTSGAWDDCLYYITPYIAGESLKARIEREGKLPLDDIVKILTDVSGALGFAHQRGIVHRDVKPGNILLAEGHAILADFGIARAVATNATPLTGSGMTPGTPAYMAPELPTDEKADVYAVGIVGYEMLCGTLPQRGFTAKDVVTRRGSVAGDLPSRVRDIASVIATASSPSSTERFSTAAEFQARLHELANRTPPSRKLVGLGLAAALLAAIAIWTWQASSRLSDSTYAILPFAGSWSDSLGQGVARQLSDALGRWDGITVIEPGLVDAQTASSQRIDLARAARFAAESRAGRFVWGEAVVESDSIRIRGALYRTADKKPIRTISLRIPRGQNASPVFGQFASNLLRDANAFGFRFVEDGGRHNLAAWAALDSGVASIATWDLDRAERAVRRATELEPANGPANLWLAQLLAWQENPKTAPDLRSAARKAAECRGCFEPADSVLARALFAYANGDYAAAAIEFGERIRRDSANLSGWIGLGDSRRLDSTIVRGRDGNWQFRGSFERSMNAYRRAEELATEAMAGPFLQWMFARLYVLPVQFNGLRLGHYTSGKDTVHLGARPFLDHDTLAYRPVALSDVATGAKDPPPDDIAAAVVRGREIARRFAEQWVRRASGSAPAYEQLALNTELVSPSGRATGPSASALEAVTTARRLASSASDQERLQILQVRLLLKAGEFEKAQALADSIARTDRAEDRNWTSLSGVALLVGRPALASRLLQQGGERFRVQGRRGATALPDQLGAVAWSILAYAAVGVEDSALAAANRFEALLPSYFPNAEDASGVRGAAVFNSASLLFPRGRALLAAPAVTDPLVDAQRALITGDSAKARQLLAERKRRTAPYLPGTVAMNGTYRAAELTLALGDTGATIEQLDRVLLALPTLGTFLLSQPEQVASLVRSMELRAILAEARADRSTAAKWGRAVCQLWRAPERELIPRLERMKQLAGTH